MTEQLEYPDEGSIYVPRTDSYYRYQHTDMTVKLEHFENGRWIPVKVLYKSHYPHPLRLQNDIEDEVHRICVIHQFANRFLN